MYFHKSSSVVKIWQLYLHVVELVLSFMLKILTFLVFHKFSTVLFSENPYQISDLNGSLYIAGLDQLDEISSNFWNYSPSIMSIPAENMKCGDSSH